MTMHHGEMPRRPRRGRIAILRASLRAPLVGVAMLVAALRRLVVGLALALQLLLLFLPVRFKETHTGVCILNAPLVSAYM